jgi:hypothetical protein
MEASDVQHHDSEHGRPTFHLGLGDASRVEETPAEILVSRVQKLFGFAHEYSTWKLVAQSVFMLAQIAIATYILVENWEEEPKCARFQSWALTDTVIAYALTATVWLMRNIHTAELEIQTRKQADAIFFGSFGLFGLYFLTGLFLVVWLIVGSIWVYFGEASCESYAMYKLSYWILMVYFFKMLIPFFVYMVSLFADVACLPLMFQRLREEERIDANFDSDQFEQQLRHQIKEEEEEEEGKTTLKKKKRISWL